MFKPVWNDKRRCFTVGDIGTHWVDIIPMAFNHRVVLTPKGQDDGYDHGWCYPDFVAAALAVIAWDPMTQDEPLGYAKKATPGRRQAPGLSERTAQ